MAESLFQETVDAFVVAKMTTDLQYFSFDPIAIITNPQIVKDIKNSSIKLTKYSSFVKIAVNIEVLDRQHFMCRKATRCLSTEIGINFERTKIFSCLHLHNGYSQPKCKVLYSITLNFSVNITA